METLAERRKATFDANAAYLSRYAELANPAVRTNETLSQLARLKLDQAEATLKLAQREEQSVENARREVLALASFEVVRKEYASSRRWIAAAAFAAAAGITLFAWTANPPDEPARLSAGEILPKTPSDVTVLFKSPDDAGLKTQLGASCDLTAGVDAVAMSVRGETYQVATVKTHNCDNAWLTVSPRVGTVVPRVKDASGSAASDSKPDSK